MAKKKKKEETPEEKQFVVSFSAIFKTPRPKRARRAITHIKRFVFKHLRVAPENVAVSQALNQAVWKRGREHIPRKIGIKIVKAKDKANVYLKDEKIAKPKAEEKKKEEKKKEGEKKEVEGEKKEEIERKKEEKRAKEKAAEVTAIKRGTGKEGK